MESSWYEKGLEMGNLGEKRIKRMMHIFGKDIQNFSEK